MDKQAMFRQKTSEVQRDPSWLRDHSCIITGGGGFFLVARVKAGGSAKHFPLALYFFKIIIIKWGSARAHESHTLRQDLPTVAQQAETLWPSVSRRVACELFP